MKAKIYLTSADRERIERHIEELLLSPEENDLPHVRQLQDEIAKATILKDPKKTPPDVITMHTRVKLRNEKTQSVSEYALVYPAESSPEERRISVLAPLGTAMLGYRVGDAFDVMLPAGNARYTVEEILYQPEAAGDFHL